jgi:hypothetical protein
VYYGVGAIVIGARAAIMMYAAAAIILYGAAVAILYGAAGCILCGDPAAILLVGARTFRERERASSVGLGPQSSGYSVAAAYR